MNSSPQFNDKYTQKSSYFGQLPSWWLREVMELMREGKNGKRCLDLGCGHGRNAEHLSRHGFEVLGVDKSPAAISFLQKKSCLYNPSLKAICSDIVDFAISPESFDLIIVVTVLGVLKQKEIMKLAGKMTQGLRSGGFLAIEEFSPDDPGGKGEENASEFAPLVKHYFSGADLKRLFPDLTSVSCIEFEVMDDTHGNDHIHHLTHYCGRK